MSELRRLLGSDHFETLCQALGGMRLDVPKQFGPNPHGGRDASKRLVRLIGPEATLLLVFHFGSSRIYVPRYSQAPAPDLRKLKRLIRRDDLTNQQVAERVGCSLRTVEKRRAKLRQSKESAK